MSISQSRILTAAFFMTAIVGTKSNPTYLFNIILFFLYLNFSACSMEYFCNESNLNNNQQNRNDK